MNRLEIFFEDIQPLALRKIILKSYIKHLIINEDKNFGDINIVLCSDNYLLKMNQQYLEHNHYTDIITFSYVEGITISGDLFISFDRIKDNAESYKTEIKNELFRVIFHGILHLVGYNDKTKDEKEVMREKEDYYLERMNFKEIIL